MSKKQTLAIALFYLFTPIIANFLVLAVALLIDFPLPNSNEYLIWTDFLSSHPIVSTLPTFLSFLIPIIFCVVYVIPIFKNSPNAKDHAANIPITFSLLGILGWILMVLTQTALTIYIDLSLDLKVYSCLKVSLMFSLLAAILAFVSAYLILETANRKKILPLYFPDGKIYKSKKFIKPSITFTFFMYYIASGIFPIIVLSFALFTKEINLGLEISWNLFVITIIFIIAGFAFTILLSNLFKKPLKDLKNAAQKISSGNLNSHVKVSSGDEIGLLADTFNDMTTSLAEKEFIKDVFGKIVTPDVRDHLLNEGISGIKLGGEQMNVTILFCDIRGFTTLSEKMESQKIVQMLNNYFTAMSECIIRHNGIINKYIGDAIMAIFGAPVKTQSHANDAYLAALEMKDALKTINAQFAQTDFPQLKFGIGLHTGQVIAGNIGSSSRMEYTVIGDSVNVASRIEGLCKEYQKDLLISQSTVQAIKDTTPTPTFLTETSIRGKVEKIKLYYS